jgi:hypothetical protein
MSASLSVTVNAVPDWHKAPEITTIYQNNAGVLHIEWSVKGEADKYIIYEDVSGSSVWMKETTAKSIDIPDLDAGSRSFKIQAAKQVDGAWKYSTMSRANRVELREIEAWRKAPIITSIYQRSNDGNVYLEQKPRRPRNRALFREDNSSLSHGRNDRYYFVFTLPAAEADDLPRKLVDQASMIAGKFIKNVLMKGGQQR